MTEENKPKLLKAAILDIDDKDSALLKGFLKNKYSNPEIPDAAPLILHCSCGDYRSVPVKKSCS